MSETSPRDDGDAAGASSDPLTGLANHALLVEYARQALSRAARHGWSTAMVVIDVDRFRDVNESFGYQTGDEVLVQLGARLGEAFRASDAVARADHGPGVPVGTVARLGGDRFLAVCENVPDADVAAALAARVARALEQPLALAGGEQIVLTVGIGIAVGGPTGSTVEERILEAEEALRRAKRRGDGQFEVVAEGTATSRHRRVEAERALRHAFDDEQFFLHYQPKVSLESGRITGAEALLRWADPDRGWVPPLEFIPLAEETGLIVPLGAWVIEAACGQAARWHARFPRRPPLVVSVNVSGRQFGPQLVDVVGRALTSSRIDPVQLCLEVTESVLVDADAALAILRDLAGLGVKLSIDDFGTGYSSLSSLKLLPLHELKIDKSFVAGLGTDSDDTAIVAATVAMAHALGLSVIAEGVETADQLERLRVLGCQEVQGYFLSRPKPAEAVAGLLSDEDSTGRRLTDADARSQSEAPYRPERVLVVDDAADVRQLAGMALTAVGFEVHEASGGAEAITAASRILPDCVILDVSMPDMSGIDVCRALREEPATAACTIVMLTSNAAAGDKVEAFSGGADDYIVKPFSPRDLVGRVRAAMRRRSGGEAACPASGGPL